MSNEKKYIIDKILNNNSVLAHTSNNDEFILLGKGIGFNKKNNDSIKKEEHIKVYKLQSKEGSLLSKELINNIDPIFIELSSDIIKEAEKVFLNVDTNILLSLADHIAFAISRMKNNMVISNPLVNEIILLFDREYQIALTAKELIKKATGFEIEEDEVGYISLHIHSAVTYEHISESILIARIINKSIKNIEHDFNIKIDHNSISFARLMNHMKFLVLRIQKGEKLSMEANNFAFEKFPYAYATAKKICTELAKELRSEIPESEVSYLALHIERVRCFEFDKHIDR